jgi:hypothetical protein
VTDMTTDKIADAIRATNSDLAAAVTHAGEGIERDIKSASGGGVESELAAAISDAGEAIKTGLMTIARAIADREGRIE